MTPEQFTQAEPIIHEIQTLKWLRERLKEITHADPQSCLCLNGKLWICMRDAGIEYCTERLEMLAKKLEEL